MEKLIKIPFIADFGHLNTASNQSSSREIEELSFNISNLSIFRPSTNYLEVIEAGVEDVSATKQLDRLVISVDSEEMTFHEKWQEIDGVVRALGKNLEYKIIVQHFCLETWALGNKVIVSRNPKNTKIQELRMHFDVLNNDPELLPDYPEDNRNRSQFAEYYLRKLLNEKYRNLSYTKNNPKALLHKKYFHQVKKRWETTRHIKSFKFFLDAFV